MGYSSMSVDSLPCNKTVLNISLCSFKRLVECRPVLDFFPGDCLPQLGLVVNYSGPRLDTGFVRVAVLAGLRTEIE